MPVTALHLNQERPVISLVLQGEGLQLVQSVWLTSLSRKELAAKAKDQP